MDENELKAVKEILELEIGRDFEQHRLNPASRKKHLMEHIFWKLDRLIEEIKKEEEIKKDFIAMPA